MEVREQGLAAAGLRVFVSSGSCLACSGAFEMKGEAGDVVFECEGVSVYVDPISITYLEGATIDYVDSLMEGGFKIENPNAASSGCLPPSAPGRGGASSASGGGCGGGCSH